MSRVVAAEVESGRVEECSAALPSHKSTGREGSVINNKRQRVTFG